MKIPIKTALQMMVLPLCLTACSKTISVDRVVDVAPNRVICEGMQTVECLLVRPHGKAGNQPYWYYFGTDLVQGITFEKGTFYTVTWQETCPADRAGDYATSFVLKSVNKQVPSTDNVDPKLIVGYWEGQCEPE